METLENCTVCPDCDCLFDDDQLIDGLCQTCSDAEYLTCIVCTDFVTRGENEGDEQNPLCSDCADSWTEPD